MKDINVGELLKFGEHLALECKKDEYKWRHYPARYKREHVGRGVC